MTAARRMLSQIPTPLGVAGNWALVFYDDFDGAANAAPDLTKWSHWLLDQVRRDATNRSENTQLDGLGNLRIRTTSQDIGHGAENSSGGLETLTNFGPNAYVEVRAALVDAAWYAGWWQTFGGMEGLNTPPDPADGAEYDVVESFQGGSASSNVHYGGYGANHQQIGLQAYGGITQADQNTYGFQMSIGRFRVNGSVSRTDATIISTRTDNRFRVTHEYEVAMGSISTPRITLVDYVRIWVPR